MQSSKARVIASLPMNADLSCCLSVSSRSQASEIIGDDTPLSFSAKGFQFASSKRMGEGLNQGRSDLRTLRAAPFGRFMRRKLAISLHVACERKSRGGSSQGWKSGFDNGRGGP